MNSLQEIELAPIKISTDDFDRLERSLINYYREKIYGPIMRDLDEPATRLDNAKPGAVATALNSGRITYNRGVFSGRFNSSVSKELKSLGARWDRKQGTWNIPQSELNVEIRNAISGSGFRFQQKLDRIDAKLAQVIPENFAQSFQSSKFFDSALWKTDKDFKATLRGLTVSPTLTPEARKKIADEWQNNMSLWIKDFTQAEIEKLRKNMRESVFAGNRYESAIKTIQKSYDVTQNKAKFLARQETSLLMAKFKETRYTEAGVDGYKWAAVAGSANHPVRPAHEKLAKESKKGKIFKWNDPPITTEPGEPERRNNPGQDYNCRCYAIPVVKFKKG